MSTITESERKRLQSLKEKKQAFKTKQQIISKALTNVDNTTKNNRIIFDDDFGEQQNCKLKEKKKRDLFDDDGNEDSLWNESDFSIKKKEHITLGNDKRFTLDDRFMDDKKVKETIIKNTDECDLQKEKERQLDILGSILGMPLTVKENKRKTETKDRVMIRYNPTETGHSEYEMNLTKLKKSTETEQLQEKSTKKKHKKHVSETENPAPIEVSKDIYFTVSDALTKSLKQKEGFSLLKAYGREKDDINTENCDVAISENDKDKKFKFNFSMKDISKYDDSFHDANENADEADKEIIDETKNDNYANNLFGACYKDTLFFDNDDVRFNEAMRFFDTEAVSNNEFKNLRRELKMIVRTKIRKNEKRNQPWGKKRKIRS